MAKKIRLRLISEANQALHDLMKIEENVQGSSAFHPDVVMSDVSFDSQFANPSIVSDPMHICANRTKPVQNAKFQKRVGAKKAKKLELDADSEFVLSPQDATTYIALSARCNYLAQDRTDISFSSKELCRQLAIPNVNSFKALKRLVRYLAGLQRLVYHYSFQSMPEAIDVYVDTDFAGCKETRRSTSGGIVMLGGHNVKHWSKTQTTISLSSGESELHGIALGCSQALGIQSLCRDMGWHLPIRIWSDATAAIGIARRKGLGKIRHLDVTDLWIQDQIRGGNISLDKVLGTENPSDVLTKYVDRATMQKALKKVNLIATDGRPASAPQAMGI